MKSQLAAILLCAALAPCAAAQCQPPSMLVPAYFDDDTAWSLAAQITPGRQHWLIANPDSGPGKRLDPNYQHWVAMAKGNGHVVLGYIPTGYGARTSYQIRSAAARYRDRYGITDFFLDETSTSLDKLKHYRTVVSQLGSNFGANIVLNTGIMPPEAFFNLGANTWLVVFENKASEWRPDSLPEWFSQYAGKSFLLAHHSDATAAVALGRFARDHGFKGFYATEDGADGNPWDVLSAHWRQALTASRCEG